MIAPPSYNIWIYSWSIDDIMARHENSVSWEYIPQNYPVWSDKKWAGIYHNHNKALKIIERNKETEKRHSELEWKNRFIQVLKWVVKLKELQEIAAKKRKDDNELIILKKSGNRNMFLKIFITTKDTLLDQSDESLIWLMYYMRCSMKNSKWKIKKDAEFIIDILEPVNKIKWLPLKWNELKDAFAKIPLEKIKEFQKLV